MPLASQLPVQSHSQQQATDAHPCELISTAGLAAFPELAENLGVG